MVCTLNININTYFEYLIQQTPLELVHGRRDAHRQLIHEEIGNRQQSRPLYWCIRQSRDYRRLADDHIFRCVTAREATRPGYVEHRAGDTGLPRRVRSWQRWSNVSVEEMTVAAVT